VGFKKQFTEFHNLFEEIKDDSLPGVQANTAFLTDI